jgi:hypothetical protein
MHLIELLVHQFLQEINQGSWKASPSLLEKFGEDTVKHLKRQFEREPNKFTIRASNIGRPICQLLLEQAGIQGSSETNTIRNLYGDLVEDVLMFVLHAAGVPIVSEQELVSIELAGAQIQGTLDVVIDFGNDPRVWDIKSASDWSFKNKFDLPFEKFLEQDTFGYADQLFLYSAARGCKAGGWIVKNKSDGQIRVVEAPEEQRLFREASIRRMEEKVGVLLRERSNILVSSIQSGTTAPLAIGEQYKFQPIPEFFRKKPTGNMVLNDICVMCDKKFHCFPEVQLKPKAKSEAKNPSLVWYTSYKE